MIVPSAGSLLSPRRRSPKVLIWSYRDSSLVMVAVRVGVDVY